MTLEAAVRRALLREKLIGWVERYDELDETQQFATLLGLGALHGFMLQPGELEPRLETIDARAVLLAELRAGAATDSPTEASS